MEKHEALVELTESEAEQVVGGILFIIPGIGVVGGTAGSGGTGGTGGSADYPYPIFRDP